MKTDCFNLCMQAVVTLLQNADVLSAKLNAEELETLLVPMIVRALQTSSTTQHVRTLVNYTANYIISLCALSLASLFAYAERIATLCAALLCNQVALSSKTFASEQTELP